MPTTDEFLAQAERNERFAEAASSLAERFTEWEVTALFYAALHYVNAFLKSQDLEPQTHHARGRLVQRHTEAWDEYHSLYVSSVVARYGLKRYTPAEVDELRAGPFQQVKTEMLQRLSL